MFGEFRCEVTLWWALRTRAWAVNTIVSEGREGRRSERHLRRQVVVGHPHRRARRGAASALRPASFYVLRPANRWLMVVRARAKTCSGRTVSNTRLITNVQGTQLPRPRPARPLRHVVSSLAFRPTLLPAFLCTKSRTPSATNAQLLSQSSYSGCTLHLLLVPRSLLIPLIPLTYHCPSIFHLGSPSHMPSPGPCPVAQRQKGGTCRAPRHGLVHRTI